MSAADGKAGRETSPSRLPGGQSMASPYEFAATLNPASRRCPRASREHAPREGGGKSAREKKGDEHAITRHNRRRNGENALARMAADRAIVVVRMLGRRRLGLVLSSVSKLLVRMVMPMMMRRVGVGVSMSRMHVTAIVVVMPPHG
jgi:hypothetical protein